MSMALNDTQLQFTAEPLFRSIGVSRDRGAAAPATWHLLKPTVPFDTTNPWQTCHDLLDQAQGLQAAVEFIEPDLTQQWLITRRDAQGLGLTRVCGVAEGQNTQYPSITDNNLWFRDKGHGEYDAAMSLLGDPGQGKRVRIAHLDTGYDPNHETLPVFLNKTLQKNFVDDDRPDDASDDSTGLFNNIGHGTGTLSILAGAGINGGKPFGVAPYAEVVPIRVADRVVLFRNSAIAKAFDYVHLLCAKPATRVHVVTMSMGGIASQAWADAINALYEAGVFVVTAAGNNYANLPTHEIVYPARFSRVVAACGVMANGAPYADLAVDLMAGNYGPQSKMTAAMAAYTPNTPWARFGCNSTVDWDGTGTSAATPQIAATAALWIQKNRKAYEAYSANWMRVEAVRKALFEGARFDAKLQSHLGRGKVAALTALGVEPANASALTEQKPDSAAFPILTVLAGLGVAVSPNKRAMLELEALQVAQASGLETELPDGLEALDAKTIARIADELLAKPGLSKPLREALGARAVTVRPSLPPAPKRLNPTAALHLNMARQPTVPEPPSRSLRVYAYDPSISTDLAMVGTNDATIDIRWEKELKPGPVGEYIEVVDVDPASNCCYAPVDLNHPHLLAQNGLTPSEANPQFHQQMSYAVAMRTIEHFERALGRTALWSPRFLRDETGKVIGDEYVQRLRIYPHALRAANSFYSSERKALLLGYFQARAQDAGNTLPGGRVFCAISHDIVAHETAHALLDGLHRRYQEPTNPDMLAFHEAFADIVALFQHFTIPEALLQQVKRTRGDFEQESLLGQLAVQFGEATTGSYRALRAAIGRRNPDTGKWEVKRARTDYDPSKEPHELGAVLVSAVFAAYIELYKARTADLVRLATSGSGVLPPGEISHDLAMRLAIEASKLAGHILDMCIRALDYCPPVDLTFGEYLRALITADRDLIPDDVRGYRVAFISAFRDRGIFPSGVQSLSVGSLTWEPPPLPLEGLDKILKEMDLAWNLNSKREVAYRVSKLNALKFRAWLLAPDQEQKLEALGFDREAGQKTIAGATGDLRPIEVHSVRPARRIGPDGQSRSSLVVEITQGFHQKEAVPGIFRSGCTLLIDLDTNQAHYFVRKRLKTVLASAGSAAAAGLADDASLRSNYFGKGALRQEPFALLHGRH
jgi:hypothetical protein